MYTVKSGYWLSTHLQDNEATVPVYGDIGIKSRVWKCSSPPKIQHFMWKILSRSLATFSNLRRRHIRQYDRCHRCCAAEETEKHLFFDCPYAQMIWRSSGVVSRIILSQTARLKRRWKLASTVIYRLVCNILRIYQ